MVNSWLNNDGLYITYGTDAATVNTAGDFQMPGGNRVIEVLLDLTTLTSTAAIQSNTTFFPAGANIYIEQVEVTTETAGASGTSFSVGLIQSDRATIPSNYSTAFINAMVLGSVDALGEKTILTAGSTYAGGLIGSTPSATTAPYYITALSAGTFTTGKVRVRIYYHGVGVISQ